jgi:hypothetical protein
VPIAIVEKKRKMRTPKDEVATMLDALPESSSYEDIQYHLYVLEKIKRGVERAEAEGAVPTEVAEQRLTCREP